jgi:uncharacterized protein YndB with AHSA1/START domain
MTPAADTNPAMQRDVIIARIFDAPRALVFKMWTDPKHMAQWWGPAGFTNPVCEMDVRPGGTLRIVMRAPDGVDYPMTGVFREVVAPQRLVFVTTPVDAEGKALLEGITTVTFAEQGAKTNLALQTRAVGFAEQAARMLAGMDAGWTQSLERLATLLAQIES